MLPREDFVFCIGYDGPIAVVDKQAKKKYGKLSTSELAQKGFFRAAYSSAVYSGSNDEKKIVAESYFGLQQQINPVMPEIDLIALDRLFGVFLVDVKRALYI